MWISAWINPEKRFEVKVAILSPIAWRTPPLHYGPWEQVASNIAEGMVGEGLDVTLFATGDSRTAGRLESVAPGPWSEHPEMDPKVWECLHISHLMERAGEFDLIHNHFDFLPLTWSGLIPTPLLTTIHGFSSPKILPVYRKYNGSCAYVSISNSDRHPDLDYIATVYNGIREEDFTFRETGGNYLIFFGRIHPEKGCLESIRIAKMAKMKLVISGLVQDQHYFKEKIEPEINGDGIVYVGNTGGSQRDDLLGNARALLHPVLFEEPFGLSVAEAMYCGTPVIAFNRGSMPELVLHGETGYLVRDTKEAIEALPDIPRIDRKRCHEHVREHFTQEKMVQGYLEVYRKITGI